MSKHEKLATEAGSQLGFGPRRGKTTTYGLVEGYPAQITAGNDGEVDFYVVMLRYDDEERDAEVKAALESDAGLSERKIKGMEIGEGMVVYKRTRRAFGSLKAEQASGDLTAITQVVLEVSPPKEAKCVLALDGCEGGEVRELTLLDNVVNRVCETCLTTLHDQRAELQAAYDAIPTRWAIALPVAFVLTLVGAGVWGGILIASDSMWWMVAIGIGALIGWGVAKAAVKGSLAVQLLSVVSTVVAVVSGNLLFYANQLSGLAEEEGAVVDWGVFVEEIPNLLIAGGGDTLFAVGGGMIGAILAAHFGARVDLSVSEER